MKAIKPSRFERNFTYRITSTRYDPASIVRFVTDMMSETPKQWILDYIAAMGDIYVSFTKFATGTNYHAQVNARRGSDNVLYSISIRKLYAVKNPYCSVSNGESFLDLAVSS